MNAETLEKAQSLQTKIIYCDTGLQELTGECKLVMWLVVLCQRFDSKEDKDFEYWRNQTLDQITKIEKELNRIKFSTTSND